MNCAVLLLVFNRPDKTAEVFESVRAARPPRLYVSADGPRSDRPGESERCVAVREIVSKVDWPCELSTLFREHNLGCKLGVSSGIGWFFEHESEGIILEDDVLPEPGFFKYCDELLERYRDDDRVGAISGCNFLSGRLSMPESYFFSRYCHIWGWATWRRNWKDYDAALPDWPAWDRAGGLERIFADPAAASYWRRAFGAVHRGEIDTWDYQWQFHLWRSGSLCAVPARNQTSNLGFDGDATHTVSDMPAFALNSPAGPLSFPLVHPDSVDRSEQADQLNDRHVYGFSTTRKLKAEVMRLARRIFPGTKAAG